ncbi:MAG: orotidine 5'-phosphate decarboxylase [Candidatus Bathyarchaeales archaeon]
MSFKVKIEAASKEKQSPVVLALDFPFHSPQERIRLLTKAQRVLDAVHPYICAVKINHHLVLPLGTFNGVQKLVTQIHEKGLPAIMDCKVNDVGSTNQVIAEYYFAAGFDALIANPFIGWEEGLKPIFEIAHKQQRGVILLAYMSHKGAKEGYGQKIYEEETGKVTLQYLSFAEKALKWNADGAVVGATYPEKIREVHDILREKVPIYSPGIGAQGGAAEIALNAGARYLIVGREVTLAENPAETAKKLCEKIKRLGNAQAR